MESPPESVEVVRYFAAGTTEKDQGSKLVMEANLEQKVGQVADEHESLPHHLKRLFLYCSLFPSGYEFSKDELIQLWIAEGFIRERQNQRMEDTASEHFNSLEKEGFFVLSRCDFTSVLSATTDNLGNFLYKVNPIKHSILEDTISSGNYFRAVDGKLDGASEMTRHLSLICEDIDGMTFGILHNFKHLRTLHLLSCRGSSIKHVPRDFCFTLTFLRTLNLRGTLISELPSSIGNVKSLRYIDASHTPISRLPESIDSLHKLQTIKLRGCIHFVQLPKGMKKLTNLRHIDLDIIQQLDSMPAHLGNLNNLQTLPAFLVGRDDGCHVGELKNLNDLKGALNISRLENVLSKEEAEEAALIDKKRIHSLELRWSNLFVEYAELQEKVLECLQPHSGLKELQIQQYSGSVLPTWISNPVFADLVVITLYRCRNCKLLPCMGQLPALKSLSIIEANEVKEINHQFFRNGPVDHAFPKLERLEVDIMLNLKEWKDVQMGDLPSLVKLTLDSCSELITLPALSWLKSLKHLELRRCPKLMSLPNDGLPTSLEAFLIMDCLELKEWCLKSEHWSMLCHLPSIWFDHEEVKKVVLHNERTKKKAMKAVSDLEGLDSVAMDMKDKKVTVIGDINPGWTNSKSEVFDIEGEEDQAKQTHSDSLASFIDTQTQNHQPIAKLEYFLGDSMVRYSDSQTETQDSSLTEIYDQGSTYFCDHHQHQDLKATTGFQAFSANSGSEVEDSSPIAWNQLACAEFTGHSVESIGNELGFSSCAATNTNNALSLGVPNTQSSNREKAIVQVDTDSSKKISDTFGQRTSIYKGVTRHRWTGRYEAHLWDNSCRREGQTRKGRQVYLGGYGMEDKAARAYDLAALKYWGPTTTTNFPVSTYSKELEDMKLLTRQEFVASLRRRSSGFSRGASIYRGVTRHHQQGRWQARIGRVAGNKDLDLGTFATQEEAAEAYDIAAIKFRGIHAVTNFEMNRYDVEAIVKSLLPVGGSAKCLKISLESEEQKPSVTNHDQQQQNSQCSSGSNSNNIHFASSMLQPIQPIKIRHSEIPYDHAAALYDYNLVQQFQPYNYYGTTSDSSAGSHPNIATNSDDHGNDAPAAAT